MYKILGILGKDFENFWENFLLIVKKLIQLQYTLLNFWVDFKKIFSKFEKMQMQKGYRKFLGSFFIRFSSIESIVVGINTIESAQVSILLPSLESTVLLFSP